GPVPVQTTQGAFPDLGGHLIEDHGPFARRAHDAEWPGAFIAFARSLFVFRHPVREGFDLWLDPFDLSLEFRSDPFEFPFRLQAVHGVFLHRVLGSPDLRAIPRLDPPEPFQFSFELVRGEENRGFREDHVDQRIPRPDLLALQRRPRRLEPRLARAGREAVDERFPENPQLALEGILEHSAKRPPGFLELVLNTHEGIFAFLPDRTAFRAIRPQPIEEEMRSRFHI